MGDRESKAERKQLEFIAMEDFTKKLTMLEEGGKTRDMREVYNKKGRGRKNNTRSNTNLLSFLNMDFGPTKSSLSLPLQKSLR